MDLIDLSGRTVADDMHSVVAVEVEGGDACIRSSPAEEQRQEQQQEQQQQQGEGAAGRETAGGEEGDAPAEITPLFIGADVDSEIIAFAGDAQFLFLGLVAWSWRRYLDGKENTVDSQVVTSVPRATEALDSGWEAGNRGWKCAAALGDMGVMEVLWERSNPWEYGEWEEVGDKGECDMGECGEGGEWGDGIFAAGAASGNDKVLEFLMVERCYKDELGVQALEVAVRSGRADVVACCYSTDLGRDEDGYILNEQFAAAEAIATPPLKLAVAARHGEMMGPLCRFLGEGGEWMEAQVQQYAKDGDLEMVRSLKEMIMCDDGRHEHLFLKTFWTAAEHGRFSVVSQLLTWWWTDQSRDLRSETDGQNLVPDGVLFMVARLGHLKMLQWCKTNCPVVGLGFCVYCASAAGWSRVLPDAAGAGHVHLVLWCLDNGWGYSESVMEAAAKEGRWNVIVALVERGFSCRVHVKKAAPFDEPGHPLFERYICELPRCEWH